MVDSRPADRTTMIRADAGAANLAVSGDEATILADGETTERPRRRAADLEVGDRVGRYRIEGKLGAGGMGSVYAAHDPDLDRRVAIKVLHTRVDDRSGGSQRLLREAQAMARLTHANVVTVHDVGVLGQRLFVAMELIDGSDLKAWLDAGPRPWKEIVAAFVAAGQGLAAAHAAGIIHRDFKPDNVMLAADGRICVGDFGLAAAVRDGGTETRAPVELPTSVLSTAGSLTVPGAIMGTPAYMAPEQMIGAEVTPAADIFSFCVALFEALHGVRPFRGDTVATIFLAIRRGDVVATKTKLPRRLDRIVRRGLAADPDARWPSMDALLAELRSLIAPRGRWLALAGVGLSGALAAALILPDAEPVDCSDSGAGVTEVWTPARRSAVEASFAATGLVYAPATAERVGAALDGFAATWSEARAEVCEERGRGEISDELSDLRVACLDRQLDELDHLLAFFAGADKEIVNHAVAVARDLPRPARCDPAEVLAAASSQRERSPELDALEAKIADAKRLHGAGKYSEAIALLDPVVARLEELDAAELLAEALVARSHSAYVDGRADADVRLRRALAAALAVGNDRRFAQAVADQLGLDRDDDEARELWLALGEAAIERVGGYDSARAKLLNNYGNALRGVGRTEEAIEVFDEVVRLRRRGDADAPELVADALFNLGNCYRALDDHARARELMAEATEIWRRELGPQHPRMVVGLQGVALSAAQLANYDEALSTAEQALAVAKETLRPGHVRVIHILGALAVVHEYRGELEAARDALKQALALVESGGRAGELERSYLLLSLAGLELEAGNADAARALNLEARALHEEPQEHAEMVRLYLEITDARLAAARGDHGAATASFGAAKALVEALGDGAAPAMGNFELARTELALAAGRIDEGLATVARIRAGEAGPEALRHPATRARLGFMEAQLLAAAGRDEEAVVPAKEAAAIYAEIGGFYERRRVAIEAWLAARGRR